jgi:uncharacterized protein YigE (DUF2233 family)
VTSSAGIAAAAIVLVGLLHPACICDGRTLSGHAAWRELSPGLAYRLLETDGAYFHLVKVDPARHELRVADARRAGRKVATVDELAREADAAVAVNGTFFDENLRPLGLVMSEGKELNPLRNVSWWAALVVRDGGKAEILTTAQLTALDPEERRKLRFAMQVGPRTVVAGRVLKLKNQTAARTAACVLPTGEVVLLATEIEPVESNALARWMSLKEGEGGVGCDAGLMLDGGSSTQLHLDVGGFRRTVRGGWGVPNALVVIARK